MWLKQAVKVGKKYVNPVATAVGGLSIMFKVLPLYLTNKEERVPKVALGPFRTDLRAYETPPASGLRVTWFGHSASLLEIDGVRLLVDPVWDERASPWQWMGPRRFFAPTIPLAELPLLRPDAVLFSHDHYDHMGEATVRHLAKASPDLRWIVPMGVGTVLRGMGVPAAQVTELDWTRTTVVQGSDGAELTVTALPTRHFSGRSLFNRFETLWASYALRGTSHNVYYGADSGFWDGFSEIGAAYGPFDLTMLEVGAYHPLWSSIHMGPEGAMQAFAALGGHGLLMPIHWGLFDLALHGWREPIRQVLELAASRGVRLWTPEPGLPTEVVAGQELRSGWWQKSYEPTK